MTKMLQPFSAFYSDEVVDTSTIEGVKEMLETMRVKQLGVEYKGVILMIHDWDFTPRNSLSYLNRLGLWWDRRKLVDLVDGLGHGLKPEDLMEIAVKFPNREVFYWNGTEGEYIGLY